MNRYDYTELAGAAAALNTRFGGKNPGITSAIFTNGELDPYFSFGINASAGDDTFVFNIPRKLRNMRCSFLTSLNKNSFIDHFKSADLHAISAFDSPEVIQVKREIFDIVTGWARR